jgi:hypothetical protein
VERNIALSAEGINLSACFPVQKNLYKSPREKHLAKYLLPLAYPTARRIISLAGNSFNPNGRV